MASDLTKEINGLFKQIYANQLNTLLLSHIYRYKKLLLFPVWKPTTKVSKAFYGQRKSIKNVNK